MHVILGDLAAIKDGPCQFLRWIPVPAAIREPAAAVRSGVFGSVEGSMDETVCGTVI